MAKKIHTQNLYTGLTLGLCNIQLPLFNQNENILMSRDDFVLADCNGIVLCYSDDGVATASVTLESDIRTNSLIAGWAAGQCLLTMLNNEAPSNAMLSYNGTILPAIPLDIDQGKFPFLYIRKFITVDGVTEYYLYQCAHHPYKRGNYIKKGVNVRRKLLGYFWSDEMFAGISENEDVIWTNFNLFNEDGSQMICAATPPIYVSGEQITYPFPVYHWRRYGSYQAPKIPAYDTEYYNNAIICKFGSYGSHREHISAYLYLIHGEVRYDETKNYTKLIFPSGADVKCYNIIGLSKTDWSLASDRQYEPGECIWNFSGTGNILWTLNNLYHVDDTLVAEYEEPEVVTTE